MVSQTSRTAVTCLAVAVGGAAGAALRYQLWRLWPTTNLEFPLTTLLINAFGCFFLGAAIGLPLYNGYLLSAALRPTVTFGLLGGFTTFSFFAVQSVTLVSPRLGMLYLLLTPAVAVAAATVGMVSTSALLNRRRPGRRIR
ncbi:fluoride efflux transporter FluC [Rhodococcus opacus]|uniref:fluoride efflux transporter FluC n=1 Tax=Rhodococcus opacus TaxID=37919 RepID=UPI0009B704C4|nr:CrcB family protein [Rhodococcus opacus]